jgi:ankyrin repeat protein
MQTTEDDYTALINAAEEGDPGLVNMILDKGANVNAKNRFGQTALMSAAEAGHLEVVKVLLAKGANVNVNEEYEFFWLEEGSCYLRSINLIQ